VSNRWSLTEQSVVGQVDNAPLVLQGTTRNEDGGFVVQLDLGGVAVGVGASPDDDGTPVAEPAPAETTASETPAAESPSSPSPEPSEGTLTRQDVELSLKTTEKQLREGRREPGYGRYPDA
jgi:hypothetical protein